MKKNLLKTGMQIGFFLGLMSAQIACDGNGSADVQSPVTAASAGEPTCYIGGGTVTGNAANTCCDKDGVPLASPPASCPKTPGLDAAKNAINGFAASAVAGRTALSSADGMVGNSGTGGLVGSSAATASDALVRQASRPANSAATNSAQKGEGPGLATKLGANSSQGGGGGGGAPMSGSGNLSGFGAGVSTQAADTSTQPAAQPSGTADNAAAYAGVGGGGGRGGSGGGFGSLFGENGGAQGGRGQDAMSMGRNPAGEFNGSQDPADYFGMLKPTDNLFKIVERRYTEKAGNWARSDAINASQAVKKLTK